MTLIAPGSRRRPLTQRERVTVALISGLLIFIGVLAFGALIVSLATSSNIREAINGPDVPGVGLDVTQAQPEGGAAPYFELTPIPRGEAVAAGIRAGDRLVSVDGEDVTGLTLDEVRARLAEKNVSRAEDDFQMTIGFLRPSGDQLQPGERVVPKRVSPTLPIAYLKSFGVVVPLLVIALGVLFLWLGVGLFRRDGVAARWALVALLWLMVGLVVAAIWAFWVQGKGGLIASAPFNYARGLAYGVPLLLAIIPMALAYRWLSGVINTLFAADETLTARSTRFAWTLLVPTLAVLILIAGRPLEQTFIKSLTDEVFATGRPARYIGLENYKNLLSVKLDSTECQKADDGSCRKSANGSTVWQQSTTETRERAALRAMTAAERKQYTRYDVATTLKLPWSNTAIQILGKDPVFLQSIGNTLQFAVISVILELILGLIIALAVNSRFKGRGLMRAAMLVPWAIPTVVSAVLWQVILRPDQTGIFNKLLMDLGIIDRTQQWFAANGPWMPSIIAVDVWKTAPFMALLLLAGLQVIPGDLYEAASVDGASKVRQFFSITLPLLRPTIAVAMIFRTLDALRAFDVFQVLLDTTRPSMATYNYNRLVLTSQAGYASAVGVIIFVFIFLFTVVYVRFVGIERE